MLVLGLLRSAATNCDLVISIHTPIMIQVLGLRLESNRGPADNIFLLSAAL